jgi:hypothetical protein
MDYVPSEFADVPFGSITAQACSPRVADPRFKGIAIRLPDRIGVAAGEALVLPICGYYQLDTAPLLMGADIHIHARGVGGTPLAPIIGKVVTNTGANEPDARPPKFEIDPRDYAGQVSESYFFFDAQSYLPVKLPPGTYDIAVSYGRTQSNVARVEVAAR